MAMLTEFEDPTKGRVVIQRPKKGDPSTIETVIYDNDTKQETVVRTMHNPQSQPVYISPVGSNTGQSSSNQTAAPIAPPPPPIPDIGEDYAFDAGYVSEEDLVSDVQQDTVDARRLAREDEVLAEIELILMTTGIAVGVTAVTFLARFPYLLWNPSLYASALALVRAYMGNRTHDVRSDVSLNNPSAASKVSSSNIVDIFTNNPQLLSLVDWGFAQLDMGGDELRLEDYNPTGNYTPEQIKDILELADTFLANEEATDIQVAQAQAIILQQRYGVDIRLDSRNSHGGEGNIDPNWDNTILENQDYLLPRINNTYSAVTDIVSRIEHNTIDLPPYVQEYLETNNVSSSDIFRMMFGDTLVRYNINLAPQGNNAGLTTGTTIDFFKFGLYTPEVDNIVHEFAHILDNRSLGYFEARTLNSTFEAPSGEVLYKTDELRRRTGFITGSGIEAYPYDDELNFQNYFILNERGQQTTQVNTNPSEEWADSFLFWVYNAYSNDAIGARREQYANQLLSEGLSIILPSTIGQVDTEYVNNSLRRQLNVEPIPIPAANSAIRLYPRENSGSLVLGSTDSNSVVNVWNSTQQENNQVWFLVEYEGIRGWIQNPDITTLYDSNTAELNVNNEIVDEVTGLPFVVELVNVPSREDRDRDGEPEDYIYPNRSKWQLDDLTDIVEE